MQFDIDEKPQETLLDEYPKCPLYIEERIA
jgi:hypothetical protein